jgi:hypothetical protein
VRAEPVPGGGWAPTCCALLELGAKVEKGEPGHGIEGDARSASEDADGYGYCPCTGNDEQSSYVAGNRLGKGGVNFPE